MLHKDTCKSLIQRYIHAKDKNRPHLMPSVFAKNAVLNMQVESDNIRFPPKTVSCESITETLVRNFSQRFENVYTFCCADTVEIKDHHLQCDWLVAMTDRADGGIKVGYGQYTWFFEQSLVTELTITIHQMLVLEAVHQQTVFGWIEDLPYTWCDKSRLLRDKPDFIVLDKF